MDEDFKGEETFPFFKEKIKDLQQVPTDDAENMELFFTANIAEAFQSYESTDTLHIETILENIYSNLLNYPSYSEICGELLEIVIPYCISQQFSTNLRNIGYKLYIFLIETCPSLFNQDIGHAILETTKTAFGDDEETNHYCWDFIHLLFHICKEEKRTFLEEDGLEFLITQFMASDDPVFDNQIAAIIVTLFDESLDLTKSSFHQILFDIKDKIATTSVFSQFVESTMKSNNDDLISECFSNKYDLIVYNNIRELDEEYKKEASDVSDERLTTIIEYLKAAHLVLKQSYLTYDITLIPINSIFDFAASGSTNISLQAFNFIIEYVSHFEERAITQISQMHLLTKLNDIYSDHISKIKDIIIQLILQMYSVAKGGQLLGLLRILRLDTLLDFAQVATEEFVQKLAIVLSRMIDYQLTIWIFRCWHDDTSDEEDAGIIDKLSEINDESHNEILFDVIQKLDHFHSEEREKQLLGEYSSLSDSSELDDFDAL